MRRALRRSRARARVLAHGLGLEPRVAPHFLVIGAQKCATSTFYTYLCQHPSIARGTQKEVHYFSFNYERGPHWYSAQFPRRHVLGDRITGEATPRYIFDEDAPARAYALVPEAALIAILRDPVDRAISHYHHEVRAGRERLPMREAFAAEPRDAPAHRGRTPVAEIDRTYVRRGRYREQIERWLRHDGEDRLLVLGYRDVVDRPVEAVDQAAHFLGLPAMTAKLDLTPSNVHPHRSAPEPGLREELAEYFAPHNEALWTLLGRRPDW